MLEIDEIELGDHAALFYRTKAEQLEIVIPFIAIGLERNERCLYIAEDHTPAEIRAKLQEFGVDVPKAQEQGALNVVTKHETYLRHGAFQPDKMIIDLCNEVQASVDLGFAGLRAAGELSWALICHRLWRRWSSTRRIWRNIFTPNSRSFASMTPPAIPRILSNA